MKRPFLVGQHLYLRAVDYDDVTDDYLGWLNDPEVTRYMTSGAFPATHETLRAYIQRFEGSSTDILLAIVDRETDQHVGTVTLNHINWIFRSADTGLMIGRREFWGRGYALESWSLICDHAFRRLNLHKIVAAVAAANTRSVAVLQKLGFQVEGTMRSEVIIDGEYADGVRLGLLRNEFRPHIAGSSAHR